jgi:hypothetical protein
MTGYLARLAARTGIGEDARPASSAAIPPLEAEDVVIVTTQPAGPAAPTALSPPDSRAAPFFFK